MEILDPRRIKLVKLLYSRLRIFFYLIRKGKLRDAYVYLWVSVFTRDSGLALMDWLYRINPNLAPYPQAIEVEVTTHCHLKCLICEHTYWKEPPRNMSFDEFQRVVDQFPKLKWIGVTGIGSSFLNKDFLKMLKYLKSRHVFIEFFDHFDLIDENTARQIIEIGVDKIWVSIDAATKETYDKIRKNANFENTVKNIKTMMRLKEEYGSPAPEIWFHYIMNKLNLQEMPQFVELVHSIVQGNKMAYSTLIYFTSLLYFKEVEHLIPEIPQGTKKLLEEKTRQYGIYLNWNENVECTKPISDCTKWTEPFVLVTGHIQPCCAINEANDRDFQKQYSFGNLFQEDYHDIWKSDKLKQFRKQIHKGATPRICKDCRIYKLGR